MDRRNLHEGFLESSFLSWLVCLVVFGVLVKEFDTVESVDVVMELASHGCICLGGLLFVLLSENRHLQQREQKCFQFVCQILKRMFLHGMTTAVDVFSFLLETL